MSRTGPIPRRSPTPDARPLACLLVVTLATLVAVPTVGTCRTFTVDEREHEFLITPNPKTRSNAIVYSLLLPGSGQRYKGQTVKGWLFTLGVAGSAGYVLVSEGARRSAVDDFEEAQRAYNAAITQFEMDHWFDVMGQKLSDAEDKKKQRNTGWMACGGIWLLNVIDAALGWPAAEAGVTVGLAPGAAGGSGVALTVWR